VRWWKERCSALRRDAKPSANNAKTCGAFTRITWRHNIHEYMMWKCPCSLWGCEALISAALISNALMRVRVISPRYHLNICQRRSQYKVFHSIWRHFSSRVESGDEYGLRGRESVLLRPKPHSHQQISGCAIQCEGEHVTWLNHATYREMCQQNRSPWLNAGWMNTNKFLNPKIEFLLAVILREFKEWKLRLRFETFCWRYMRNLIQRSPVAKRTCSAAHLYVLFTCFWPSEIYIFMYAYIHTGPINA
jgi:hypothetical protein